VLLPDGAKFADAAVEKVKLAGVGSHGISTEGMVAVFDAAFLFQCSVTLDPYACATQSATTSNVAALWVNAIVTLDGGVNTHLAASWPGPGDPAAFTGAAKLTVTVMVAVAGATYTPLVGVKGAVQLSFPPVIVNPVNSPAGRVLDNRLARNHTLPLPSARPEGAVGGISVP
jgi:hypothetical protein